MEDDKGVSALFAQAKESNWDNFKEKADQIPDLAAALDGHGETLLHWAAANNNADILAYLVDTKKLYINQANFYHATPLYYAAMKAAGDAIDFFISRAADPRQASAFSGKTPAQVCNESALQEKLQNYTNTFERRILSRPFPNYYYRVADHWRTSLQFLRHPNGRNFYSGFPCYEPARLVFLNPEGGGPSTLIEVCKLQDTMYEQYLRLPDGDDGSSLERMDVCMICETPDEARTMCKSCGLVPICERCWGTNAEDHSPKRQIHVNNCKRGLFK